MFAERKAYTAISFKMPTTAWKDRLTATPHLAIGLSRHPQVTFIGNGAPVTADGEVVAIVDAVLEKAR